MSWGNPTNPFERLLKQALSPLSLAYGVGSSCWLQGYKSGLLDRKSLVVPVVSVGNITCGGTGKTPVTIDLGARLLASGLKVGILSRGYKRKSKDETVIVSDGAGRYAECEDSGDEPYLIAKRLPKAVVLVGSRRRLSAEIAITQFGCEVLLLDDGFQHFPLQRDIDLVLVDYNDEPQNDCLVPAGRLREPLSALARASSLVITKVPANYDPAKIKRLEEIIQQHAPGKPINKCRFLASNLVSPSTIVLPASTLNGQRVIAVSALARPSAFHDILRENHAQIVDSLSWPDHHWYSNENMLEIERISQQADIVVTTEKDLVKMKPSDKLMDKLYALRIEAQWIDGYPAIMSDLVARLAETKKAGVGA